jgi:hypothetical protein
MLMLDAPKEYFASAPSRMAAVCMAAAMAHAKKGKGYTDVLVPARRRPQGGEGFLYFGNVLCRNYLLPLKIFSAL